MVSKSINIHPYAEKLEDGSVNWTFRISRGATDAMGMNGSSDALFLQNDGSLSPLKYHVKEFGSLEFAYQAAININ